MLIASISAQAPVNTMQGLTLSDQKWRLMDYEATLNDLDELVAQNEYSSILLAQRALIKTKLGMNEEARQDKQLANSLNPYAIDLFGLNGSNGMLNVMKSTPEEDQAIFNKQYLFNEYLAYLENEETIFEYTEENLDFLSEVIYSIENDYDKSTIIQTIDEAIPNFVNNKAILYDLRGLLQLELKDALSAKSSFAKAVTIDPFFAIAWYNFAQAEMQLGNIPTAMEYLDKANDIEGNLLIAKFELAKLNKSVGEFDIAVDLYDEIINENTAGKFIALKNRGLSKKKLGDYSRALIDLNKALDFNPEDPSLYFYRGNLNMLFGEYKLAMVDYDKSIQLDPAYADAFFNKALAYLRLHNHREACSNFNEYEHLNQKDSTVKSFFCADY